MNLQFIDEPSRKEMAESLGRRYLRTDELGYQIKENVVVDSCGHFCQETNGTADERLNGTWIWLGEWLPIWGHCITDNLKKLWFLNSHYYSDLGGGGICIRSNSPIPDTFKQLLSTIGVDANRIKIISKKTFIRRVIIPDDSMIVVGNSRYYYLEYANIVNKIRDSIPEDAESPKKVYFTRTQLKKRKDFGEEGIENIFRQLGFKIFAPEKLSFFEQLSLLRNCDEFATTEGSVAHNVIFCKDGVDIIIVRKVCAMISYQFMLNDLRKANVTYIDSHSTLFYVGDPWNGPFLMKVGHNLINYANSRGLTNVRQYITVSAAMLYFKDLFYKSLRYRRHVRLTAHFGYFLKRVMN